LIDDPVEQEVSTSSRALRVRQRRVESRFT
jgi:hypothetical protein